MLGLLGTITGMMGTFSSMTGHLQNTAGVTAGLAEALITTIFGLVIAITGMLVHAYLNARYKKAMLDLDAVADAPYFRIVREVRGHYEEKTEAGG